MQPAESMHLEVLGLEVGEIKRYLIGLTVSIYNGLFPNPNHKLLLITKIILYRQFFCFLLCTPLVVIE